MRKPYRLVATVSILMTALSLAAVSAAPRFSIWSRPQNLGSPINTALLDAGPFISKDGLSLYFTSNRAGGQGGNDIWVSRRESVDHAWGDPMNLGTTINTAGNEQTATISTDGHRLYFASDRLGGFGGLDLYVSRRHDKRDDLGWSEPVSLGPNVNTNGFEFGPAFFEDDETGIRTLYFSRAKPAEPFDIYTSAQYGDETFGPAEPVVELNTAANDQRPNIRRDGLELFLDSNRPGTLGSNDVWVSRRESTSEPWSTPVNVTELNGPANDNRPSLSFDGTVLYFSSDRAGGAGIQDIYVSMRSRLRQR